MQRLLSLLIIWKLFIERTGQHNNTLNKLHIGSTYKSPVSSNEGQKGKKRGTFEQKGEQNIEIGKIP